MPWFGPSVVRFDATTIVKARAACFCLSSFLRFCVSCTQRRIRFDMEKFIKTGTDDPNANPPPGTFVIHSSRPVAKCVREGYVRLGGMDSRPMFGRPHRPRLVCFSNGLLDWMRVFVVSMREMPLFR